MNNEKDREDQRLITRGQFVSGVAALVLVAALAVVGLSWRSGTEGEPAPETSQVGNVSETVTGEGCQLIQTMRYTPCGHEITRRLDLPGELVGKGRSDVEAAYDQWQVTSFASKEIVMEQQLDIYCSKHWVLMPDETGVLGIFENKYGDALAFVRSLETDLAALPDAAQEEIRRGKGFDSLEALEQWLESVES